MLYIILYDPCMYTIYAIPTNSPVIGGDLGLTPHSVPSGYRPLPFTPCIPPSRHHEACLVPLLPSVALLSRLSRCLIPFNRSLQEETSQPGYRGGPFRFGRCDRGR